MSQEVIIIRELEQPVIVNVIAPPENENITVVHQNVIGLGPQGNDGQPGAQGLSAYEVALQEGFIGTEDDWLNSLRSVSSVSVIGGEIIPSFTPVAIVNGQAFKYDSSNIAHLWSFAGFSRFSSQVGELVQIQQSGTIQLPGWNLVPNSLYFGGLNGAMVTAVPPSALFEKIIGYAIDADTLLVRNFVPILINP